MNWLKSRMPVVCLLCFGLILCNSQAEAISISLETSASQIAVGESLSVDIVISGLTDTTNLTAFDVDIKYTSKFLEFDSYSLGSKIDNLQSSDNSTIEIVIQDGEFNLSVKDLSQPDDFTIAKLILTGKDSGTSFIYPGNAKFYHGKTKIEINNVNVKSVKVNPTSPVPEPGTIGLLGLGLVGLACYRKKLTKR